MVFQILTSAYDDEIEQIKSTHRLPLNTAGEPAHVPSHYDVRIDMGGLREEDKNEEGYFEYSGHSNINFNWNTDSNFVVLHAGSIPGYEVVSAELSTGSFYEDGPALKTSFEHYKEKEMLIIHVDEENFSGEVGNQYNLRVQFKNWLAKSNTGLYESSYLDEVGFSKILQLNTLLFLVNPTKYNLLFRMVSDTIWPQPNLNRLDAEKLFLHSMNQG